MRETRGCVCVCDDDGLVRGDVPVGWNVQRPWYSWAVGRAPRGAAVSILRTRYCIYLASTPASAKHQQHVLVWRNGREHGGNTTQAQDFWLAASGNPGPAAVCLPAASPPPRQLPQLKSILLLASAWRPVST